jgi:hypothetical protein
MRPPPELGDSNGRKKRLNKISGERPAFSFIITPYLLRVLSDRKSTVINLHGSDKVEGIDILRRER